MEKITDRNRSQARVLLPPKMVRLIMIAQLVTEHRPSRSENGAMTDIGRWVRDRPDRNTRLSNGLALSASGMARLSVGS